MSVGGTSHWPAGQLFPLCLVPKEFSRQLPLATAAHNWLTLAKQGLSGALLVSFPYPGPKTAHRATRGRVWVYRFFLGRFCSGKAAKSFSSL